MVVWFAPGPSKNVSARPEVRSTNWSRTTKWPGSTWTCSEPTEHGAKMAPTPACCMAAMLAR